MNTIIFEKNIEERLKKEVLEMHNHEKENTISCMAARSEPLKIVSRVDDY